MYKIEQQEAEGRPIREAGIGGAHGLGHQVRDGRSADDHCAKPEFELKVQQEASRQNGDGLSQDCKPPQIDQRAEAHLRRSSFGRQQAAGSLC